MPGSTILTALIMLPVSFFSFPFLDLSIFFGFRVKKIEFWEEFSPGNVDTSKTTSKTVSAPSSLTVSSYSGKSVESLPTPRTEGQILACPNLKAFTFNDLKNATRNFRPESLLGEGGFGYVFKGWIDGQTFAAAKPGSGMVIAVKKLKPEGFQGHKEWLTEVNYLGQLHHPNLVKLIGYCLEGDNRLLQSNLESVNTLYPPRAQQADYENIEKEFNPKLSDFGLAKDGPTGDKTHISTQVMGTHGYAAPEYIATGRLSAKSDVYSFGVVLLELLSGRRSLDKTKIGTEQNLVDWAKPYLGEKRKLFRIMDTRLEGQYPKKAAHTAAGIALQCLSSDAKARPRMSEVLATLEQLQTLKNENRHSQKEQQVASHRIQKSPMRHAPSPLHITPGGSPLPSLRQSPRNLPCIFGRSLGEALSITLLVSWLIGINACLCLGSFEVFDCLVLPFSLWLA
ncbi:putative serine/threonine-protein kinase pbl3 [Asimina triloba]